MKSVLVTGGSGFFGHALVRHLLARGLKVANFDLCEDPERPAEIEFIQGDIRDQKAVLAACRGRDAIFHCVALVPLAKDRSAFVSVNQQGTANLLQAAREKGAGKVVYISSSAVFGVPEKNPVTEDTVPRPGEDYGKAKLAAEELCREASRQGLDVTIIRPRTIMGPGRLGIMQIMFEWIRQGKNAPVLGRGDNLYQFVHADDLAEACYLAGERPGSGLYNIGAEKFGTMRETLTGLIAHAGTKSRVVSLPMKPAVLAMEIASRLGLSPLGPYHSLMYGRSLYFDVSRARRELGWAPRSANVEMFCESYDWYLEHREEVLRGPGASPHRSAVRQGILKLASWGLRWL